MKTKKSIEKHLYEKKIRKVERPLEKFQDFILKEVKFNEEQRIQIERFYIKMRE